MHLYFSSATLAFVDALRWVEWNCFGTKAGCMKTFDRYYKKTVYTQSLIIQMNKIQNYFAGL